MGRVELDEGRSRGWVVRMLGVLAIGGLLLALAPVASASTNLTWSGKLGQAIPEWSTAANWEPEAAPAPDTAIGMLSFPQLTGVPCTFITSNDGCGYGSENDVSGLSVESTSIDDGEDYSIVGEPITLGGGGLSASPTAVTSKLTLAELDLPIALGTSQTWSIGGEGAGHRFENDLYLGGNLTGSGSELTVDLNEGPALYIGNSTEVGPVSIDGADTTEAGIFNGAVTLLGGDLDFSNGNPVSLNHIFLDGAGTLGALTTDAAELDLGSGGYPAEGIATTSAKLNAASDLGFEIAGTGATAQKDYSQLTSRGAVELGSAKLEVVVRPPKKGEPCPILAPGQTYTFISTTGTLSGSFSNAPEGGPEIPLRFAEACDQISQTMHVAYHKSGGTETVTGTVEAAAKEKQENEAKARAAKEQEAQEQEEDLRKSNNESAKRTVEETATREMLAAAAKEMAATITAKKHQEEEAAAAAAAKKHQEEETSAQQGQAEAAAGASVSLDGSAIAVQTNGQATVKLTCVGAGVCGGKLTLIAKSTAKKGKKVKTETVGTAAFSVSAGKTTTVKLALNATGRALLVAARGRLSARLTILQLEPEPAQPQTKTVSLTLARGVRKSKR